MALPDRIEFVYVGDPMCSWCWGFAPVLDAMVDRYAIPLRTIVGGLRPGPEAEPLDDSTRRTLLEHWEHVEAASGQPFDRRALDRDDWIYDTEPSATAVVTMRTLDESATFGFFKRLQRAFYAENVDITDPGAYPDLLDGFEVDRDTFMELLASDEMKTATWRDFQTSRRLSVSGFPTLLLNVDERYTIVTRGYAPWVRLEPALTGWFHDTWGPDAAALVNPASSAPADRVSRRPS